MEPGLVGTTGRPAQNLAGQGHRTGQEHAPTLHLITEVRTAVVATRTPSPATPVPVQVNKNV